MADPVVFRGKDGKRRVVTDKERAEAKKILRKMDSHNKSVERSNKRRNRENLEEARKSAERRIYKNPIYFT